MSNVTIEVNLKKEQVRNILCQLKPKDVISIIKDYQRKNWIKELDELRIDLQKCTRENRITDKEIDNMVEEVRKGRYEQTQSSNRH